MAAHRWLSSHRGGVVIAEDLAPLLDLETPPSAAKADQGLLPVLLHFDGRPQVTDQGDLIYCFPSLRHRPEAPSSAAADHRCRGRFFASTRTTDCVYPCQPGAALDLWHFGCELVGVVAVAPSLELAPVGSTCWHCLGLVLAIPFSCSYCPCCGGSAGAVPMRPFISAIAGASNGRIGLNSIVMNWCLSVGRRLVGARHCLRSAKGWCTRQNTIF